MREPVPDEYVTGSINILNRSYIIVTVDRQKGRQPADDLPDETIIHLLEEHKALPTDTIASEVEGSLSTIRCRLQKMAKVGLIERRETTNGDVWLTW